VERCSAVYESHTEADCRFIRNCRSAILSDGIRKYYSIGKNADKTLQPDLYQTPDIFSRGSTGRCRMKRNAYYYRGIEIRYSSKWQAWLAYGIDDTVFHPFVLLEYAKRFINKLKGGK
jgi:hypothetical protein